MSRAHSSGLRAVMATSPPSATSSSARGPGGYEAESTNQRFTPADTDGHICDRTLEHLVGVTDADVRGETNICLLQPHQVLRTPAARAATAPV